MSVFPLPSYLPVLTVAAVFCELAPAKRYFTLGGLFPRQRQALASCLTSVPHTTAEARYQKQFIWFLHFLPDQLAQVELILLVVLQLFSKRAQLIRAARLLM